MKSEFSAQISDKVEKIQIKYSTCCFVDVLTKNKLAITRMIRTIAYFFLPKSRRMESKTCIKGRNVKGNYLKIQNIR